MTNPIHDLTTYDGSDWNEYLERLAIREIFSDLIKAYSEEPTLVTCIIRYIVWTYTKDSPQVILGDEWIKNKKRIFDKAALPPIEEVQNDVLYLKNDVVLTTVYRWLDFQNADVWKELNMLRELRVEMQLSANSPIKKSSGEIDYDSKFKNAKYSIELYNMIRDTESNLIQNDVRLKEGVQEVKKNAAAAKGRINISPETFAK